MNDERFNRVETKVDKLNSDVIEIKSDVKYMNENLEKHIVKIENHIAGDNKIIIHIQPLLQKLPEIMEIVEDFKLEKKIREKRIKLIKNWTVVFGLTTAAATTLVNFKKLLLFFNL